MARLHSEATLYSDIRYDWLVEEVEALFALPLSKLIKLSSELHEKYAAQDIQKCVLLSIKTGNCSEDCGYCSQSAYYKTSIEKEPLLSVEQVMERAREAKADGATRFCMGAAWRDLPNDERFERILKMVKGVSQLGMEACVTLGMANEDQLKKLKQAGLTAYNHNLDTSREYYPKVVTTHTYDDRLKTIAAARAAGVQVCSGGIMGMGEGRTDRAAFLHELASMNPHPESVPINILVPVDGTPMKDRTPLAFEDFLRTVAVARILMPTSRIRLSAGRMALSDDEQRQCFDAGANSIFYGDKLLTTPNVPVIRDRAMFEIRATD